MEPNHIISYCNCIKVLENFFHHKNFAISSIIIESLNEVVSGMMAEYYKVIIDSQVDNTTITKSFFCKKLIMYHKIQEIMGKAQGAYEKEDFIYRTFTIESNKVPNFSPTFAPQCYLSLKDDLFILDNLLDLEYSRAKKECDLQHCKEALKTIAEFHASSIIIEETKSKLLRQKYSLYDDNSEIFQDSLYRRDDEYLGRHWFKNCLNSVAKVIDFLPDMPLSKEKIKEKLFHYSEKIYEIITPSKEYRNVVCHGDLSKYNILYRYDNDDIIDCKIVDFQALRYNPPAHDVVNFIYLCTDLNFRRKHLNDLLDFYYEMLKKQLDRCNMNISVFITYEEFKKSCDYVLPQAVLQKAFYNTMVPVISLFPNIEKDQDLYKKYVYEDRSSDCIEALSKSLTFKNLSTEFVTELCSL